MYSAITATTSPIAHAHRLFYDYLAHRSAESLSYGKLAADAERVLRETGYTPADEQAPLTSAHAFRLLVRPLLRTGVLSFRGSGTYGLTATQAIATLDGTHVLLINASHVKSTQPSGKTLSTVEQIALGVTRMPRPMPPAEVPLMPFGLSELLEGMPRLDALVRDSDEFPQHGRGTPEASWEVLQGSWRAWDDYRSDLLRDERVLVFRTSAEPGAPRVIRLEGQLYRVSSPRANPAAYPLALLLADATAKRTPSMFTWSDDSITVTSDFFPAELERALWLGSLLHTGAAVNAHSESRTYVLPERALSALHRILLRPTSL